MAAVIWLWPTRAGPSLAGAVPSISTFYISQKLGGGNFDLIGDTIERQFQTAYNYNLGAAMSFVLMLIIIISMTVMNKYADDDGGVII